MRRLIMLLVLLAAGVALAQIETIDLGGKPALTVERLDDGDLKVQIEVGELQHFDVQTPAGMFTQLVIPGFHASLRAGDPQLPMMNRLIALPFGAAAEVEVVEVATRTLDLADFGIQYPLMPAQPSLAKNQDPASVPFIWNRETYALSAVKASDALARVVAQGRLRAVDVARLEIAPVSYDPLQGRLEVAERIELRVHFLGGNAAAGAAVYAATYSPYFEAVYDRIDGSRGLHDSYPDLVADFVTYVIVTPSMFTAQLQPFVDWKTQRGFRVIVGEIGTPQVGTTTTSIQTYVRGLYNNGTPQQPAPSFVLFVGDVAQCPTFQMSGDPSDRPYCSVDGDLMPEMYYGRFSATNATQLQAILDKTLMYDQFTMPDPSYLAKAVLIAGMDGTYGPTHANGQINYAAETYFNAAHGVTANVHLYPASGSQDGLIVSEVSDGRAFVNYTAHGSETSWSDPTFTQANVNSLQNDGEYCLAIGNCCLTSTYDYAECFGETWLRAANKGAIGYIGGSNSTLWNEDFYWSVGYRNVISARPSFDAAHQGAYDGMFHDHAEPENRWYVTQDAIVFCGNLAVQESGSGSSTYYWNIYNLLGDPSITPYVGLPTTNTVSHPASLAPGTTVVSVSAAACSYVGLTQAGQLLGAGTVHVGQSTIDITLLQPVADGAPVKLVAMAQNRQPYLADIPVETSTPVAETPGALALLGVSPNPFNPQTAIRFVAPGALAVELSVYDLRGQKVATLVDAVLPAGQHEIVWDGRDAAGRNVTSGVYFARLAAGGRAIVSRMTLLK